MSGEQIHIDVVARVGDYATTTGTLGNDAAYAVRHRPGFAGPDRWTFVDREISSGLFTLTADQDMTVAEFARTAFAASHEDGGDVQRLWVEDAVGGERLPDDARLGDHLDDGDLVLLKAETPPAAMYELLPLDAPEHLFDRLHVAAALEAADSPRLWGALLYTEEDAAVATYVRTHFDELNAMTGRVLRIFVVERPTNWRRAKKYWRAHLEPSLLRTLSVMRWLKWTPYDKSGLYDVARELGIDPAHFPCLVLFGGSRDGMVVFPVESADPAWFRELFTRIRDAVDDTSSGVVERRFEILDDGSTHRPSERGAEAVRALLAATSEIDREDLVQVEAAKVALRKADFLRNAEITGQNVVIAHGAIGDVTFHGPTTFINKPVNTEIRDFQNTRESTT